MKIVCIGDLHGKSFWKLITHQEKPDKVVFLGDYFDSFEISGVEQIHNFKQIIEYKESNPQIEVTLLIGNHDHHYFPEIGYTGTGGYQSKIAPSIIQVIDENRHHLRMAHQIENYLFTHAGVSPEFMDTAFGKYGWTRTNISQDLNELFKYKPGKFKFAGLDPYGDDTYQTPIWIRPRSLMSSNKYGTHSLKKLYIQIVGHTTMNQIDIKGKSTGGRYYFIDTLGTSGEYLIIEDGNVATGKVLS